MTRNNAYIAISSDLSLVAKQMTEALGSPTDPRLSLLIGMAADAAKWANLPVEQKIWDGTAYKAFSADLSLVLREMIEALGSSTDPRLSLLIRTGSGAAMWAKLPADEEIWDGKDLALARANANYSDTWLIEALSAVAGDLFQQGTKEKLDAAQTLGREGLTLALAALNLGNDNSYALVRQLVCQSYLQLAHILLALGEPEQARTEIAALVAFQNGVAEDLGMLKGILFLQDCYTMLTQIARHYIFQPGRYAEGVTVGKEAAAVLTLMIEQAPDVEPQFLDDILAMAAGHKRVYENEVDTYPAGVASGTDAK